MKTYFSRLGQGGTTLVEVLIVMGLMAMLLTILSSIFVATADIRTGSNSYSSVSTEGRFIMARLNYDIARATSVSQPGSLGASGALLSMVIGGATYSYQLSGANLQINPGSGYVNLNGDDVTVSGVTFYRRGNSGGSNAITYSFTLTSVDQARSGPDTQTFTSTVQLR